MEALGLHLDFGERAEWADWAEWALKRDSFVHVVHRTVARNSELGTTI